MRDGNVEKKSVILYTLFFYTYPGYIQCFLLFILDVFKDYWSSENRGKNRSWTKRKLDWYVPIFYIQSLKLFREASRINFLIISHPHSTESRFSSLQHEHDKWVVQDTILGSYHHPLVADAAKNAWLGFQIIEKNWKNIDSRKFEPLRPFYIPNKN